ncbi:hypothetical protein FQR65_LT10177 [Abscondita terminalis]|nr:hypothetical protein FQR65_LT10177 [Abscondita terminalis]
MSQDEEQDDDDDDDDDEGEEKNTSECREHENNAAKIVNIGRLITKNTHSKTWTLLISMELPENFFDNSDNFIMIPNVGDNKTLTPTASESSKIQNSPVEIEHQQSSTDMESQSSQTDDVAEIPSKYLYEIAPMSFIPQNRFNKRKQSAEILTSEQFIQKKKKSKDNLEKKIMQNGKSIIRNGKVKVKNIKLISRNKMNQKASEECISVASTSTFTKNSPEESQDDVNCDECLENYLLTRETVD